MDKKMAEESVTMSAAHDDEILQKFFKTYEEIFKFKEVHPNERITIERLDDYIYFVMESGVSYKIGKITMNDEEYRVVTEAVERAGREGGNLIMLEYETQQDGGLMETLDEDLLLNDQETEQNFENDLSVLDNGKAGQIDSFEPVKTHPQIKSIESCHFDVDSLKKSSDYASQTQRVVSRFKISNVSINNPNKSAHMNDKNDKMTEVNLTKRETTENKQNEIVEKVSNSTSMERCEGIDLAILSSRLGKMVESVTKTMSDITNVCDKMNRLVNTGVQNITNMNKNFEQEMKKFHSNMEQQANDNRSHAEQMQDILSYYLNDENDELTEENENSKLNKIPDSMAAFRSENFDYRNEFKSMIRDELKNLGLCNLKNENLKGPNLVANEVKEAIKVEFINKDSGTKRDYKLTTQMRFEHFMDYFTSELRANDLLYVIDSNVKSSTKLDDAIKEKNKFKVRDILINHLDQNYHSKVVSIKDPVELLNKIKELKRCETNLTSVNIRKQLYSIQYVPNKEKASEFWDKFEDLIRNYDNLPDTNPLTDEEKRDSFYHAIMTAVPQVQSVEFMTKNTTGKGLTYEQLKTYIIQNEANKMTTTTSSHMALNVQRRDPKDRCFNCDDYGHIGRDCTMKGTGLRKCYECNEFVTHKAVECPQRLAQQGRVGRGGMKRNNTYKFINSKRSRGGTYFNNTNRGFKRKNNNSGRDNDAKRPKFVNSRGRGGFNKSRGSRQQNNWAPRDKKNLTTTEDSRKDKANQSS